MPSRARDKQLAKLHARRKSELEAAARRRRILAWVVGGLAGVLAIAIGYAVLKGGADSASPSSTPSVTGASGPTGASGATGSTGTSGVPTQTGQVTPEAAAPGRVACDGQVPAAAGAPKPQFDRAPSPKETLDKATVYTAVVKTSCGSFEFRLLSDDAPQTVASFVFLARQGFFDGLVFHRIVPGFVIQTGDPLGTGGGGPGYEFGLEVDPKLSYDHVGQVAMARAQDPSTNGSQWFVTIGEASNLDQLYTIFGDVTAGLDVVRAIGKVEVGGASGDQPQLAVYIESVTIRESTG